MKNSWKLMSIECQLNVLMELFVGSSRISSHTLQITLRSKKFYSHFHMLSEPVTGHFLHVSRTSGPFYAHDALFPKPRSQRSVQNWIYKRDKAQKVPAWIVIRGSIGLSMHERQYMSRESLLQASMSTIFSVTNL
jgi:hypothetical protein